MNQKTPLTRKLFYLLPHDNNTKLVDSFAFNWGTVFLPKCSIVCLNQPSSAISTPHLKYS